MERIYSAGEIVNYTWNVHSSRWSRERRGNICTPNPTSKEVEFVAYYGEKSARIKCRTPAGIDFRTVMLTSISKIHAKESA